MRKLVKVPFLSFLFLAIILHSTVAFATGDHLKVDFNVSPSQDVIVKPVDANAKASIDFNIIPKGEVKEAERPPIDVVFVFDKSGSMNSTNNKMQNAKNGLTNAVQFFEKNKRPNDRFSLITFSSEIETILPLSNNLDAIKTSMLHTTANGGTNYTDPLRAANNMLKDSKNEKYIVFLTDGQPMIASAVEKVKKEVCTKYWFVFCSETKVVEDSQEVVYDFQNRYSQNTNSWLHKVYLRDDSKLKSVFIPSFTMNGTSFTTKWYNPADLESNSKQMQALIKQKGLEVSKEIYNNRITMHTLGYGEGDLDDQYLELLAQQTSGSFIKASEGSVSDAFEKLANKLNSVKLDGEIVVQLPENVTVDHNHYNVVNRTVSIPFSSVYEVGQGTPSPITVSLPVEFSSKGTYLFKDMKIKYKTADEPAWKFTGEKSVTIEVKDDAPASVTGMFEINKINQDLFNLIIETGRETSSFTGVYELNFGGLVNPGAKGTIKDIIIHQPLPEGISVRENANVTIETNNGQRTAIIHAGKDVSFDKGIFSQPSLSVPVSLNAVWAVNNVKMPQAKVYYVDSRYNQKNNSNLNPSRKEISAKVRTRHFQNVKEFAYDGYANGTIKKVRILGQSESVTAILEADASNKFPNIAVKSLMIRSTQLDIRYKDDSTSVLTFVPTLEIRDSISNEVLKDEATIGNEAEFFLSEGIPGSGVTYQYRHLNEDQVSTDWASLELDDIRMIEMFGKNKIQVIAKDGFALDDYVSSQTVWIEGDDLIRVPSSIELYVGETKSFDIDIFPFGKPNNNYTVRVLKGDDGIINSLYNQINSNKENRITGLSPGEDLVEVATKNGKYKKLIRVIVKSRYISLENMDFTKSKYTLLLEGEKLDIRSNVVFNPTNATNKDIKSATDTGNGVVNILKENGEWKVEPKNTGITTITIVSDENPAIKASAVIEVVSENEETEDPGSDNGSIDGRW
ncbi:VWA domain-containing protein [Bacillus sp. RO3]|nr:VWA domain-containing protein [Bacillus sp. RO3]